MAGQFLVGVSKVLSGVYSIIKAAVQMIIAGARGTVAYCFTSDWGPVNVLTLVTKADEFDDVFNGTNTSLTANKIAKHAFRGRPNKILAYRMALGTAAKGVVTLNDSGAAKSLELETLYPSARAFTAVVKDGLSGGKVVQIIEGNNILVSVEDTTVAGLEAKLNISDYVRVKSKGSNMPNNNAGVAFAGGNNGSTVTATEYTAFLDVLEADQTANAFAFDGVTDETILALAETWVKRVRTEGLYITFVRGGLSTWDANISLANTKAKAINHRGVVLVGNGVDGFTAADLAIYVAARVASVALNATLTDEPTDYLAVNKKLKPSERIIAKEAGTLIFIQDGDVVRIDEGVNTLTSITAEGESLEMCKIRVNNALDAILKDLEKFGDEYKRTRSNTDAARETFAATVEEVYFKPLAAAEVIKADYTYRPDPNYHGTNPIYTPKLDEAFFAAGITPVDSMEKIYQTIGVNFNA